MRANVKSYVITFMNFWFNGFIALWVYFFDLYPVHTHGNNLKWFQACILHVQISVFCLLYITFIKFPITNTVADFWPWNVLLRAVRLAEHSCKSWDSILLTLPATDSAHHSCWEGSNFSTWLSSKTIAPRCLTPSINYITVDRTLLSVQCFIPSKWSENYIGKNFTSYSIKI